MCRGWGSCGVDGCEKNHQEVPQVGPKIYPKMVGPTMILENDRCFFNEFEHVLTMILENDRCFLNEFLFEKE